MSHRMYRLMERHQKLDGLLALARQSRCVDPLEVARLKKLKLRIKELIHRFTAQSRRRSRHAMS